MKHILLLFSFFFLFSCKKENNNIPPKKVVVIEREIPYEGKIIAIDSDLFSEYENPELEFFYNCFKNETVWQSTELRTFTLNEFKDAENEGLFSKDYNFSKLEKLEKKIKKLSDDELVTYDLELTLNFLKYIKHISQGKLNPKAIYGDWDLKPKSTDVSKILLNAFKKQNDFIAVIDSCKPQHSVYKKLNTAMIILNSYPDDKSKKIEIAEKIVPKDTSNVMIAIKKKLIYWKDLKANDSLTKIYDSKTVEAVKNFQFRHGLASDGVIGKGTLDALNFTKKQRKHQIMANLERWKWYPNKLNVDYLLVNIPDYNLVAVENKDTIRTHKVIVGTNKRKTPILTSKLSYAVFNPTWTVPPTIIKEDIIPAMTKNKNYLTKKNITVFDSRGFIVCADDWKPSKGMTYRYVQSPGDYNSLGMVKIIFPNRFSVYLHDTNHRNYFDRNNRSLSSGCVRVENPIELTQYLLKDSINFPMDSINSMLKIMTPKSVPIKTPTYLYQWYWTAWSDNNKLIFRDDIYNLDEKLYQKLSE